MKKTIFLFLCFCFFVGCSSRSQVLIQPDEGKTIRCASSGYGLYGVVTSGMSFDDCVADYKKMGYVEIEKAPTAGFSYIKVGESKIAKMNDPAVVVIVMPSGPAYAAGLKTGDTVIKMNNEKINTIGDTMAYRDKLKIGDTVAYTVLRDKQELVFNLKLISLSDLLNKSK